MATEAELNIERAALDLALRKVETSSSSSPSSSWAGLAKSTASSILASKNETEHLYRDLLAADFTTITAQQKMEFLLKIKELQNKLLVAYQTTYISLTCSPEAAQEISDADSIGVGLSQEQQKRVKEFNKKKEDQAEKAKNQANQSGQFNRRFRPYNRPYQSYQTYQPAAAQPYQPSTTSPYYPPAQQTPPTYPPPQQYPPQHSYSPPSGPPPTYQNQTYPALTYKPHGPKDGKRAQIDQEKAVTECLDCGERGHWRGDSNCPRQLNRVAGYMLHPH